MIKAEVEVRSDVQGASGAVGDALNDLIAKFKLAVEYEAKLDAPVVTGFYRGGIGQAPGGVIGRVNYSIHVENRHKIITTAAQRVLDRLKRNGTL